MKPRCTCPDCIPSQEVTDVAVEVYDLLMTRLGTDARGSADSAVVLSFVLTSLIADTIGPKDWPKALAAFLEETSEGLTNVAMQRVLSNLEGSDAN